MLCSYLVPSILHFLTLEARDYSIAPATFACHGRALRIPLAKITIHSTLGFDARARPWRQLLSLSYKRQLASSTQSVLHSACVHTWVLTPVALDRRIFARPLPRSTRAHSLVDNAHERIKHEVFMSRCFLPKYGSRSD